MGGFFQVELDTLKRFITSLRESGDHMESALNALKATESGQIGTKDLDDAANDFQHTWRYGLGQLKEKIRDTGGGLRDVHGAYQETEQAAARAMEQLTQAVSGGRSGE